MVIEVDEKVWRRSVAETAHNILGFRVPMRRDVFVGVYFGFLAANLAAAIGCDRADFGGHRRAPGPNNNLYVLRNLKIVS